MKSQNINRRVEFLDDLRGVAVIYIVAFHALYDLVYIFSKEIPLFDSWLNLNVLQPMSAAFFILIAGIVSNYSKNNLKRGLKIFFLGLALWVGSEILMPSAPIRFGVLSLLGSGMLLYAFIDRTFPTAFTLRNRKAPAVTAVILLLLFIFSYRIQKGYLGFFQIPIFQLPESLYNTKFLFILGLPHADFVSSDYYPIFPWIFLFFVGSNLGIYFKNNMMPEFFYHSRSKALRWIGLHALEIYLLHQPILIAVFSIIFKLI